MNAAIYARVSTEEQAQNFSIENQLDSLRKYCRERALVVVGEYVDPGFSGTTLDRPALAELLMNARRGAFGNILVYKLDRLFRSNRHMYNTLAEWEQLGISFTSITEAFDTSTAMGKAMLGMLSTFAEWERNTFMERSRAGTRKAVEKGIYSGGIVAYGYRLNPETKQLETDEDEASIVRQMFDMLIKENMPCPYIAQRLNSLGVPTRYAKDGRGVRGRATAGEWRPGRVYNMLRNPAYRGVWYYGKRSGKKGNELVAGSCPAIIDEATFEAARVRLKANNRWADRNSRRNYLLRGFIKCGLCGHSYVGTYSRSTSKKELRYYKCDRNGNRSQLLSKGCVAPAISADVVEDLVWRDIREFIESPETVRESLKAKFSSQGTNWRAEIAKVETRVEELREAERRLLRLYADPKNGFSEQALKAELVDIVSARELVLRRKRELEDGFANDDWQRRKLEDADALLARLKTGVASATPETKRRIIEDLLWGITVGESEDGNVYLRIVYAFSKDGGVLPSHGVCGLLHEQMSLWLSRRPGEAVHLFAVAGVALSEAYQRTAPGPHRHLRRGAPRRL